MPYVYIVCMEIFMCLHPDVRGNGTPFGGSPLGKGSAGRAPVARNLTPVMRRFDRRYLDCWYTQ